MSAIELFLVLIFGVPICVLICCFLIAVTYLQVVSPEPDLPKIDKELEFSTLSKQDMKRATTNLLKQDRKKRRRQQR